MIPRTPGEFAKWNLSDEEWRRIVTEVPEKKKQGYEIRREALSGITYGRDGAMAELAKVSSLVERQNGEVGIYVWKRLIWALRAFERSVSG
jgi:hypothetical protein